jgi:hypothetical protein
MGALNIVSSLNRCHTSRFTFRECVGRLLRCRLQRLIRLCQDLFDRAVEQGQYRDHADSKRDDKRVFDQVLSTVIPMQPSNDWQSSSNLFLHNLFLLD